MTKKGILAFSGGLDTSVVVKYLQDEHDMDVITVTVNVGQGENAKEIANKEIGRASCRERVYAPV